MKKYFCTIATLVLVLNTTMGQSISRDKAASDLKNASKQAEGAAATSGTSAADTNARAAAQSTEKAKKKGAIQNGTVVGTLTINGEVIKLKYVYAQKRSALSPGDASLFSNGTDPKDVMRVNP